MAQQTINLGTVPNDGTGDDLRTGGDKINDNFTELYAALTGLVELKGSTDCSTNPNYPAASAGDAYRVSVAGKIGGASGVSVEVGDLYYALADNAGGTQASVGTSWDVLQGNTTSSGGTVDVEDEGTPVISATTINFTGAGVVATDAGGGQVDVTIAGGGGGVDVEEEGGAVATATTLNFVGSAVTATDAGAGQVDVTITGGSLPVLSTHNITAAASVDIPLPSGYNQHRIIFELEPANDGVNLTGVITNDNFSTVETASYAYQDVRLDSAGGGTTYSNSAASLQFVTNVGNAAGESTSGTLDVIWAGEAGWNTSFLMRYQKINSAAVVGVGYGGGRYMVDEAINGIRLSFSAGNIASGLVKVIGVA